MSDSIKSLVDSGTKLWLDSIDPELLTKNLAMGATGATSNPIIVANLIKTGRFDDSLNQKLQAGLTDEETAWAMTDELVSHAQRQLQSVWQDTGGNDGYVSFELDPLLEDIDLNLPPNQRVEKYIQLAEKWYAGQTNRMIKVPATDAGLAALEEIAAKGIPLNVTLIFSMDQYVSARDAVWRGAQRHGNLEGFKSAYSIFISRIDVYTAKHCESLSEQAQGEVGIVNAKRIWRENQSYWSDKGCRHAQEIIFASTGTKRAEDPAWKYVQALAGSDIQTNPPATNDAVAESGLEFESQIADMPAQVVLDEVDNKVDFTHMHDTLMSEGVAKFATPHKGLIALIGEKRGAIAQA